MKIPRRLPVKLTNKKYMLAKVKRNMMLAPAVANLGIAAMEAHSHALPTTLFFGGFGLLFLKAAEKHINTMLEHRADYKEIVHRAIGIQIVKLENILSSIEKNNKNKIS